MPPKKGDKMTKQGRLISSFFKPTSHQDAATESINKSPKRIRLSRLALSPETSTTRQTEGRNLDSTIVAEETSSFLNNIVSNNFSRSLTFSSHCIPMPTQEYPTEKITKLTPLEEQVVRLKVDHPDVMLIVEVGYKYRIFGEDACKASKVLGISKYKKNSFEILQVPSHRLGFTVRRLVAAGLKIGVVLQSETAATKAAGLTKSGKSTTFQRHLARVYTAGTLLDDDIIGDSSEMVIPKIPGVDSEGEDVDVDDSDEMMNPIDTFSPQRERWICCVLDLPANNGTCMLSVIFVNLESCSLCHGCFEDNFDRMNLISILKRFDPVQIILSNDNSDTTTKKIVQRYVSVMDTQGQAPGLVNVEFVPSSHFELGSARGTIRDAFLQTDMSASQSKEEISGACEWIRCWDFPELTEQCLGGLLSYLRAHGLHQTLNGQSGSQLSVEHIEKMDTSCYLDSCSLCDLEIFHTLGDGSDSASLMNFLDHTLTVPGRRTLQGWVRAPLASVEAIQLRSSAVEVMMNCSIDQDAASSVCLTPLLGALRVHRGIDLNIACIQLSSNRMTPRKLLQVVNTTIALTSALPTQNQIEESIKEVSSYLEAELSRPHRDLILGCCMLLFSLLDPEGGNNKALSLRKGKWQTADAKLCQQSTLAFEEVERMGSALMVALVPLREVDQSCLNIEKSLMVELETLSKQLNRPLQFKHLHVGSQGALEYLVELPANVSAPEGWKVVNSTHQFHRYRPPTIIALHQSLLQMRETMDSTASSVWEGVLKCVETVLLGPLRCLASVLSTVDALNSIGCVSNLPGYTKPSFQTNGVAHSSMVVVGGRHPTMEAILHKKGETSVPNDISVSQNGGPRNISVITGPNMGGKSTYARMVAVLAIMGQIGCYLPCDSAELVVFDQIFTRIGVDDDLASGMSTFFMELENCSRILRSVTSKSLVLLDELGRGTSTHDGVAVAKSTLAYLAESVKCVTLFVTHYPEIMQLANSSAQFSTSEDSTAFKQRSQIVNLHMDFMVSDDTGLADVVFLYKTVEGGTTSSHGLNVAQMAGLPRRVLDIALRKVDVQKHQRRLLKTSTTDVEAEESDSLSDVSLMSMYRHLVDAQAEAQGAVKGLP